MSMEAQMALAREAMAGAAAAAPGGAPGADGGKPQEERTTYGGLDATNRPQILEHVHKSLALTVYDTKWVPLSARFVVLGSHARGSGALQVYELDGSGVKLLTEAESASPLRCGSFGASSLTDRHIATGDFAGTLASWDLERLASPVWKVQAHGGIINAMDAMGGQRRGYGAPEIVTGARDGRVCVWDPRQRDAPVAAFEPPAGLEAVPDCWSVSFGDSHCDDDRSVLAGYDNGDVKLFDLRNGQVRWEKNVKNGVCAVEFDRKDIHMNKCAVATLEGKFHVFDMRTRHKEKGYASVAEKFPTGATLWGTRHLPQNRDLFMVGGGDGTVSLYKVRACRAGPARARRARNELTLLMQMPPFFDGRALTCAPVRARQRARVWACTVLVPRPTPCAGRRGPRLRRVW